MSVQKKCHRPIQRLHPPSCPRYSLVNRLVAATMTSRGNTGDGGSRNNYSRPREYAGNGGGGFRGYKGSRGGDNYRQQHGDGRYGEGHRGGQGGWNRDGRSNGNDRYNDRRYNSGNSGVRGPRNNDRDNNGSFFRSGNRAVGDRRRYDDQDRHREVNSRNDSNYNSNKRGRAPTGSDMDRGHSGGGQPALKRSRTAPSQAQEPYATATLSLQKTYSEPVRRKSSSNASGTPVEKQKGQKFLEFEKQIRFRKEPGSKYDLLKIQLKLDGIDQRVKFLDERIAALDAMP